MLDAVVATAGLAVVRGPVGIGKTFALQREFARLETEGVMVIHVTSAPEIEGSIGSFLRAVLNQWGIAGGSAVAARDALADLLFSAHPFLPGGKRCVFIVDEAQGLKPNILEVLRGLWDEGDDARRGNTYAPAFGLVLVGNDTFLNKGGKMRKAEFRPLMSRVMIDMILSRPDALEFQNLAKGLLPDNLDAQVMLARFGAEAGNLRAIDKVFRLAMSFVESGDDLLMALGRAIKLSGGK
ncbi:MAG: ATP-binding protein [Cypionkella sp.]|nr:ATP-binding protein [Cypionkella sp.]